MDPAPVSARGKIEGREPCDPSRDAAARDIVDGDVVALSTTVAHAWPARGDRRDRPAWCSCRAAPGSILPMALTGALCAHGNANVLTYDRGTSSLGQGPSTGTNMVEIELWKEPLPPLAGV